MGSKLTSRKFWVTFLSTGALFAVGQFGMAATVVSTYLAGQSVVDSVQKFRRGNEENNE